MRESGDPELRLAIDENRHARPVADDHVPLGVLAQQLPLGGEAAFGGVLHHPPPVPPLE